MEKIPGNLNPKNRLNTGQEKSSWTVLCDFDGTIACSDVGYELVKRYGDRDIWGKAFDAWKRGDVGSETCTRLMYTSLNVAEDSMDVCIDSFKIDPSFRRVVSHLKEEGIELSIVSDGFDFYIKRLLHNNRISVEEIFSNRFAYKDGASHEVLYPHKNPDCSKCANCKYLHVQKARGLGHKIVYIGDSIGDLYPAAASDFIFATKNLARELDVRNIEYFRFSSFSDILATLKHNVLKEHTRRKASGDCIYDGPLKRRAFTSPRTV